jgi:hypothetical protein
MQWDKSNPIRGGVDTGHEKDNTCSRGHVDSSGEVITIPAHFWLAYLEYIKTNQQSEILTLTSRKVLLEEAQETKRKNKCKRKLKRENGRQEGERPR